jgi:hypothetical protein
VGRLGTNLQCFDDCSDWFLRQPSLPMIGTWTDPPHDFEFTLRFPSKAEIENHFNKSQNTEKIFRFKYGELFGSENDIA